MKLYNIFLLVLLANFFNFLSAESNENIAQVFKDIELAAKMGSGETVTINMNATEGLEGEIAQKVRNIMQEAPKPLTFTERIKSFFNSLLKNEN